ncbi:ZmpA/ZmpB/ZmpC family metallo-endopeptidase [Streptococcus sp. 20-1249]|uniref:ZmpA/ZmpB/ZmpC family metallo-endopeptidase n=1 Tax=Streptococcus hepaticus TaxID=3349163 RepID=UPI0037482B51
MKWNFRRKQRFSIRKLSMGVISLSLGFAISPIIGADSDSGTSQKSSVKGSLHYVVNDELSSDDRKLVREFVDNQVLAEDETAYYFIYRAKNSLPHTGQASDMVLVGLGTGLLIVGVVLSKGRRRKVLSAMLVTLVGVTTFNQLSALENERLSQFTEAFTYEAGTTIPTPPQNLGQYEFTGYYIALKSSTEGKKTDVSQTKPVTSEKTTPASDEVVVPTDYVPTEDKLAGDIAVIPSDSVPTTDLPSETISDEEIVLPESTSRKEVVAARKAYVADSTLAFGEKFNDLAPVNGEKVYTTSYRFKDGSKEIIASEALTSQTLPQNVVSQVGNQKVENRTRTEGNVSILEEVTTTYSVNPETGELHTPVETVREISRTEITTQVSEEVVEAGVEYRENPDVYVGTTTVLDEGQNGLVRIEKTYQLVNGKINGPSLSETRTVMVEARPRIVEHGTKPVEGQVEVVTREPIAKTETVELVDTAYEDFEEVVTEGQDGEKITRTIYKTDKGQQTNEAISVTEDIVTPVNRLVRKGTKPILGQDTTTETADIQIETEYVDDSDLEVGKEVEISAGQVGQKTITKTYTTEKGVRTGEPVLSETITVPMQKRTVKRGTKPVSTEEIEPTVTVTNMEVIDQDRQVNLTTTTADPSKLIESTKTNIYFNGTLVKSVDTKDLTAVTDLEYDKLYDIETVVTYTYNGEKKTKIVDRREDVWLTYKALEIKNIDKLSLYYLDENQHYVAVDALTAVPGDVTNYYLRVQDKGYKDIYLKVDSIAAKGTDGFTVKTHLDELKQNTKGQLSDVVEFVLPKKLDSGVDTAIKTFAELIAKITANPAGSYEIGSDLDASTVSLTNHQTAYITTVFTGTLTGMSNGQTFAIKNLAKPLFSKLSSATIKDLDLREVTIDRPNDSVLAEAGTGVLASKADKTTVTNVAVEGTIKVARNVGGIIHEATNSTLKNVSFEGTIESNQSAGSLGSSEGSIVGSISGTSIDQAKSIVTYTTKVTDGRWTNAGGLVGKVANSSRITNSSIVGTMTNTGAVDKYVGGITGAISYGSSSSRIENVSSTLTLTGPIKRTIAEESQIGKQTKNVTETAVDYGVTATTKDTDRISVVQSVDYSILPMYDAAREQLYRNLEKLFPLYNPTYIIRAGNGMSLESDLVKKVLISATPMKDKELVRDEFTQKEAINGLYLLYADGSHQQVAASYTGTFNDRVAEYTTADGIQFTTEKYLSDEFKSAVQTIKTALAGMTDWDAIINAQKERILASYQPTDWDITLYRQFYNKPEATVSKEQVIAEIKEMHMKDFQLGHVWAEISKDLDGYIGKFLASNHSIGDYDVVTRQVLDNKEKFVLGLTALHRWYDFGFNGTNIADTVTFAKGFYKENTASTLEWLLQMGDAGVARDANMVGITNLVAQKAGASEVISFLELNGDLFLPNGKTLTSMSEWFKNTSKAWISEVASTILPGAAGTETVWSRLAYGYNNINDNTPKQYRNMLFPSLTLPENTVLFTANEAGFSVSALETYIDKSLATSNLTEYQKQLANLRVMFEDTSRRMNGFFETVQSIVGETGQKNLVRNQPWYVVDTYKIKQDNEWAKYGQSYDYVRYFLNPLNRFGRNNGTGAFADGSMTQFVYYSLLGGGGIFAHEATHNTDGSVLFNGWGRRTGSGGEDYATGMFETPGTNQPYYGLNLTFDNTAGYSDHPDRYHNKSYTDLNSDEKVTNYMHGIFDVIYTMDAAEGEAIIESSNPNKYKWFKKIEKVSVENTATANKYKDVGTNLTADEFASMKIDSLDDLVNNHLGASRNGQEGSWEAGRNNYVSVPLFNSIWAAQHANDGISGGASFRVIAFEMLAEFGFTDGLASFVSDRYAMEAKAASGKVNDDFILSKIFNGKYTSYEAFRIAMYNERKANAAAGMQSITVTVGGKNYTINNYESLKTAMKAAVALDEAGNKERDSSNVWGLKRQIYQKYLNLTDDFKTSIFTK